VAGVNQSFTVYAVCANASIAGYQELQTTTLVSAGNAPELDQACPAGDVVVGGGYANTYNQAQTDDSAPNPSQTPSSTTWAVVPDNTNGVVTESVTVYAVCVSASINGYNEPTAQASGINTQKVSATCPSGDIVLGGGESAPFTTIDAPVTSSNGANNVVSNAWTTYEEDPQGTVEAIAICAAYAPPAITGLSPASGPATGGTSVVISGSGFSGATVVDFGSVAATSFTVTNDGSITATAPPGADTQDVTVTTPIGTSATSSSDVYRYVPVVTAVSPASGPTAGGRFVTITGSGFTGATFVDFGFTSAGNYTVNNPGSITVESPSGSAGTVDVTVTTAGGTSATGAADRFTYVSPPTVTGVSPSTGPAGGGTSVTVTGSGFTGASGVAFGSTAATAYQVKSDTQITATSPQGAGTVDVTVTAAGGTSATGTADRFVYLPAPSVTTGAASGVSINAAVLNGVVNANGITVSNCHFEWGTSAAYGSSAPCVPAVGAGTSPVAVAAALSGMSPGTTYHYRVVATGTGGTADGADEVFATASLPATSLSVACSPTSVFVGQASTCAATVSSAGGVPSGTVSFASSGSGSFGAAGTCMLAGSGTSAGCSVSYTPAAVGSGTHTITARYAGDAAHAGSTGTTAVSVSLAVKRATSVAAACSPGTVAPGSSTSCTVTVADTAGGGPAPPGGVVDFVETGGAGVTGGGSCVLSGSGGSAHCSVTYTAGVSAIGTYTISAIYGGDGTYAGGAGLTSFAVTAPTGVAAAVQVLAGTVLIRESSGAFVPLGGSTVSVPIGSEVDARKGVVRLVTAADYLPAQNRRHRVQVGTFSVGIFVVKQVTAKQALARARARHQRRLTGTPSTDLELITPPGAVGQARCRRTGTPGKGVVRALKGVGTGLYRTFGANSVTTVRSATWTVEDRCDGTLTEVRKGHATVTSKHTDHPRPVTVGPEQSVLIKGRFA
jgi:IPT/TIG domain/Bacterial Ig-like domain (group 3)